MPENRLPDALRDQIDRSRVALALATASGDMPLVRVNAGFTSLTGYAPEDALDRNCRFLQGPETPADQVRAMSRFLRDDAADDGRFPVLNHTRDGRRFLNLVFMTKLRDGDGRLRFVLASQFDTSASDARTALAENDAALGRNMQDLRRAAGQFGLIMSDSTALIARSISTLARISFRDE